MSIEIGADGRGWVSSGTLMRRSLAWWKAASRSGVQVRVFPAPFRAFVNGASTLAAPRRN